MARIPRSQMTNPQRALADLQDGAARRLGRPVASDDDYTHDEQARIGTLVAEHQRQRAAAPQPRSRKQKHRRAAAPALKPRDVVRSTADRVDEDHELRTMFPATLLAVDEISEMMRLDLSKSPSLRRAYIETQIKQLRAAGKRDGTEAGDRAWTLYRRYDTILRRGGSEDGAIRQLRDHDRAVLRRKSARQ